MEIIKDITTRNFTKGNNKQNKYIVIHYVGAVSSARANAKYFKSTYRGASAHYFVDEKEIVQVVEDKDIAWHCGANYYKHLTCRNSNSIGIEMCCYNNNGKIDVSEKVVERTIELTKELMAKYNIPVENVLRHYDVTGKNCPAPFVSNSNRWNDFRNRLKTDYGTKFSAGERVEITVPIAVAFTQHPKCIVENLNPVSKDTAQFWVHETVIENDKIHALANICYASGNNYIVQVFDDQFWVKENNIKKA